MAKTVIKPNPKLEQEWHDCIAGVSQNGSTDIYIVSGGLNTPVDDNVITAVERHKSRSNAFLLLTTFGGDADVAYRIARCFQQSYSEGDFAVFVPETCKSAGTLLTIGAGELIMSNCAQLGPLDVQLGKPDELGEVISGLIPVQSLDFLQEHAFKQFEHHFLALISRSGHQITTKTAAEVATKLTVGVFQPVYSQLDPLKLGEYRRNMMVTGE